MNKKKLLVWDLPTRLFHWLLAFVILQCYITFQLGYMSIHEKYGYVVIVLVLFRLVWGFLGSTYSRFSSFLVGPSKFIKHFRGGEPPSIGHNPAGGWSVIVMLLLVLVQGVTGLFNTDDLMFEGPFFAAVSIEVSGYLGEIHVLVSDVLLVMISLHIGAILFYWLKKKDNLVKPMFTGIKPGVSGNGKVASNWLALLVLLVSIGILVLAINLAPEPELFY